MQADVYSLMPDIETLEVVPGERVKVSEPDIRVIVVEFDDGSRASVMGDAAGVDFAEWSVAVSADDVAVPRSDSPACLARDFADRREPISCFLRSAHEGEDRPEQAA